VLIIEVMRIKLFLLIALVIALTAVYILNKQNNQLRDDNTRLFDNYNAVQDTNGLLQKQVQDIREISLKEAEISRTENEVLKGIANDLRKDNARLKGLIQAQIVIRDTVKGETKLDSVCRGTIKFMEPYFRATVTLNDSTTIDYEVTAPIDIIRYVKQVPKNPRKFTNWAIEHKVTRWLVRKKEQDRITLKSDNPKLTTSVQSYQIINE
jgi:hypothetical protein